jgi:hypothetical protein
MKKIIFIVFAILAFSVNALATSRTPYTWVETITIDQFMALLGFCLFGLAVYGKRRINREL